MNHRLARGVAVGAAAVIVLSGCAGSSPAATPSADLSATPSASESAGTGEPGSGVQVAEIVTGLDSPWSIAFVEASALVSERDTGRIVEITPDGEVREVGVIADVDHGGEGGLLGLATDSTGLFVYSTGPEGNRIQRFELTGSAGGLGLGEMTTVLEGIPASSNHNGGRIAFGPDGLLYATTGDAGDRPAAQDEESLAGKILRLQPDGGIPADNPFPGSPVFSLGHRNPQGLAWGEDGTLYASEFGQDTWDELNVITPGGNYGWPEVEGIADRDGFIDPVQQWAPDEASPSGMAMFGDDLFVANLRGERLRSIPLDDLGASVETLVGEFGRLRDIVVAPEGTLWVLTNNTDGRGDASAGDDRILRLTSGE